jgi:hypothetical protein
MAVFGQQGAQMGDVTSIRTARRRAVGDRAESEIEKLLGQARFKLIETGTRRTAIREVRNKVNVAGRGRKKPYQ